MVPNNAQSTPLLIGHPVTDAPEVLVYKDHLNLRLMKKMPVNMETHGGKVTLWAKDPTVNPVGYWGNIGVRTNDDFEGELYIETSLRTAEGQEHCIPRTVVEITKGKESHLPVVNLSEQAIRINSTKPIARGWPCRAEEVTGANTVLRIDTDKLDLLTLEDFKVGTITREEQIRLITLLNKYRTSFAKNIDEIGCAKSANVQIVLEREVPFTHRPYRMFRDEEGLVRTMIDDLLRNDIVRESNSPYSPRCYSFVRRMGISVCA